MSILSRWKNRDKGEMAKDLIEKVPKEAVIPLSGGQQRLFFIESLYPDNPVYNSSEIYTFKGRLVVVDLKRSLQTILDLNDVFRCSFHIKEGVPFQIVADRVALNLIEFDISDLSTSEKDGRLKEIMTSDALKPFELRSPLLIRTSLIKVDTNTHILFITMHHIIVDKWSMGLFREQLAKYYQNVPTSLEIREIRAKIQFVDYAYWENHRNINKGQLEYWKNKLSGNIPQLQLPTDYPQPATPTFRGDCNIKILSKSLSDQIIELSRKAECTPYILLLSAYYVLLFRYSRQNDIIIGSPISIRTSKVLENIIGFFDETIVLRTDFPPTISFLELVNRVRQTVLEAFSNNEISFDVLVKELKPDRVAGINPYLRTMFIYHDVPPMPFIGEGLEISYDFFNTGVSKFDLTLYIANENGQLLSEFEYSTDLFDVATIEQFQEHYRLLLTGVTANPEMDIGAIPMLTVKEKEVLLPNKNIGPKPFEAYNGIHEIISRTALDYKNAVALVYGQDQMTYGELNELSDTIAQHILSYTNNANQIVGVCLERSNHMIAGLVGILKAGCAYLPIDPDYPLERISFMLEDSKVPLILTHGELVSKFISFKGTKILLKDILDTGITNSIDFPKVKRTDLAYVIYTSGSSGKPKGVPITHSNIINSTEGRLLFYPENPKVFLLMSSIAFDSSKAGIFWTLCTGGTLVISEKRLEQDVAKINEIIYSNKVSHTLMLPSLYNILLEYSDLLKLRSLTTVIVAGEACSRTTINSHFNKLPNIGFYNEYGPTEASVWCMAYRIGKGKDLYNRVPIGSAVANAEIYLLDPNLNLVPFGTVGEIYVGGPGLANSYLNRPDLTEEAYINNPFSEITGSKLYKTGDLGRYRSDGEMLFLGRADQQVKIRGFRVELSEIEEVIQEDASVNKALVIMAESENRNNLSTAENSGHLIAYVESKRDFEPEQLMYKLSESLPNYMVPSLIIPIPNFSLLPNGKIDRSKLPEPKLNDNKALKVNFQGPRNELEVVLTRIWEEVLNISPISIYDNFFKIGGDSILSIQIVAKARGDNIILKPTQIFENQTIEELSLFANFGQQHTINEKNIEGNVSLTPIQHWFFNTHHNAPNFWNQIVRLSNVDSLSRAIIKTIIEELVSYHDALRLRFIKTDNWKALVASRDVNNIFYLKDVSGIPDAEEQNKKIQQLLFSAQEMTNLADGQLFKCFFFKCGQTQDNQVFMVAHHLIIDVVSWNILFNDLNTAIKQVQNDKPITLKGKTASIKQWGAYQIELSKSKILLDELPYWKSQKNDSHKFPSNFVVEKNCFEEHTIAILQASINEKDTKSLQQEANWAYNTKIEELLITALHKILRKWSGLERICFGMEKHGRNAEFSDMDVSGTVGWFTSYFPVSLKITEQAELGEQIKAIKEQLRDIPNNGLGYGILKYLSEDGKLRDELNQQPQLVFNYLGNKTNTGNSTDVVYDLIWEGSRHPKGERSYGLEINAYIQNGQLFLYWSYSTDLYTETTVKELIADYERALQEIIVHCANKKSREYTPSDFPEASISQDDLNHLLDNL
ncbi:non-ribosomal peptide synthetase [Arenibacter certesii]|uniref:Carrier domain-containing protein n=1 Tax=Arenibacter certesii TaxID=228955 RepID=A0A918MLY3_9FLAO|nr:non-ribosomal peptide synthetase [Arenibacter certesii]GGW39340.1 hypothetical protein GCM10007383_25090 [Arenibacter certesii]